MRVGLPSFTPRPRIGPDVVGRGELHAHRAVRVRRHGRARIGEVGLRAQHALGLREQDLRALFPLPNKQERRDGRLTRRARRRARTAGTVAPNRPTARPSRARRDRPRRRRWVRHCTEDRAPSAACRRRVLRGQRTRDGGEREDGCRRTRTSELQRWSLESARLSKRCDDERCPLGTQPAAIAIIVRLGRRVRTLALTTTVERDRRNAQAHRQVRVGARRGRAAR